MDARAERVGSALPVGGVAIVLPRGRRFAGREGRRRNIRIALGHLPEGGGELAVLGAGINRALPSDPAHPDERVSATATPLNRARTGPLVRRSLFVLMFIICGGKTLNVSW